VTRLTVHAQSASGERLERASSPALRRAAWQLDGEGLAYAMLIPAVAVVVLLILLPLVYSVFLSLFDWRLLEINRAKTWAGLDNYLRLFTDRALGVALLNTALFVIGSVAVELALGFVVATALFNINRGRKLANAIILLPMIITPVITALLWRYLLDPQFGLVAQTMSLFGANGGVDVWGSSSLALPGLMLVDIWQWTPFVILVLHAGMLSIPIEQFEAAAIDGAGQLRIAWSVVLPALMPQVLLVLLFRTMDTYRLFDTVFVLTRGGPRDATETIGLYTYRTGFSYTQMGYAMALSVLILVTVALISGFYIRLLRREGML
jgi:multiple sugar transport system permease protein